MTTTRFFLFKLARVYYTEIFFFFLLILAFSISTSRLVMSMSQLAMASLWVLNGRYREKLSLFFHNRMALILSSLFVLHIIGLFYSNDMDSALKDLRIKTPLILLPFFFSSLNPYNIKKSIWILLAFIAGVFYASAFVSMEHWINGMDVKALLSARFIKHMRFSLDISMALFSALLLSVLIWRKAINYVLTLVLVVWFFVFMLMMSALSAFVTSFLMLLYLTFFLYFRSSKKNFLLSLSGSAISFIAVVYFGFSFLKPIVFPSEKQEMQPLEAKTMNGNYYNTYSNELTENGKRIYSFVCEKELKSEWEKRSSFSFDGADLLDQELKATLIRYLNSLDLPKDSFGLSRLSNQDILNIENGIANKRYAIESGIKVRLMQLAFELEQTKTNSNPSGYSFGQRLEYWKVSWYMIRKDIVFGYGSGDNDQTMHLAYLQTHSLLPPEYWFRPHNQFLSIWLSFGLFGLLVFLFCLFYPPLFLKAFKNPFYVLFFISFMASFFVEDTLETQSGVTYFIFFNAYFLMLWPQNDSNGKLLFVEQKKVGN